MFYFIIKLINKTPKHFCKYFILHVTTSCIQRAKTSVRIQQDTPNCYRIMKVVTRKLKKEI